MNVERYREAEAALWRHVGVEPRERRARLVRHGTEVRAQETGQGRPVLFLHGAPNGGATWAPLAPHLRDFRCIFLDRPGTGLSEPARIPRGEEQAFVATLALDVLDALGIERADLVGSSLGGYAALRAAASAPARIGRVILMGSPGPILDAPVAPFLRMLGVPGVARLLAALPASRASGRMMTRQIGHGASIDAGRIPAAFFDWYLALQRDTPTMREELTFLRRIVTVRGFRRESYLGREELAAVHVPVRLVWGSADAFGGEDLARRIASALPRAELQILPNGGHLPWLDDPEAAAQAVVGEPARERAVSRGHGSGSVSV